MELKSKTEEAARISNEFDTFKVMQFEDKQQVSPPLLLLLLLFVVV